MVGSRKKRMTIMLICVGIIFGAIFGYLAFKSYMIKKFLSAGGMPPVTVSAMKAGYQTWQPRITAIGSIRSTQGVDVTTEIAGAVKDIYFTPGSQVEAGTLLIELTTSTDIAQLHALEANAELAKITYERNKAQYEVQAVAKAVLDQAESDLKAKNAQVAEQIATINKKIIRAPFAGRLGISLVDPGQFLNPGDKIVTLQALDPIFVDFFIPQQALSRVKLGMPITLTTDSYPKEVFSGKITTINPVIDLSTRNITVEATLPNPHHQLLPGMFARVQVDSGQPQQYLTLPQTAISFNPYGDIVYVITEKKDAAGKNASKEKTLIANQRFVVLGDTRGDQIAIVSGIKEGETVVTAGQLKLKNGSPVIINNSIVTTNNPSPDIVDQ